MERLRTAIRNRSKRFQTARQERRIAAAKRSIDKSIKTLEKHVEQGFLRTMQYIDMEDLQISSIPKDEIWARLKSLAEQNGYTISEELQLCGSLWAIIMESPERITELTDDLIKCVEQSFANDGEHFCFQIPKVMIKEGFYSKDELFSTLTSMAEESDYEINESLNRKHWRIEFRKR